MELTGRYSNPKRILQELTKLRDLPLKSGPPKARERPQTQNRLAPDAVEELTAAYQRGSNIAELAAAFSINRSTVHAHLARQKVERRRGLISRRIDEAADLYTSGWSLAQIGKHMNVDAETVRRALREAGVPIRPRNGWPPRPTPGP